MGERAGVTLHSTLTSTSWHHRIGKYVGLRRLFKSSESQSVFTASISALRHKDSPCQCGWKTRMDTLMTMLLMTRHWTLKNVKTTLTLRHTGVGLPDTTQRLTNRRCYLVLIILISAQWQQILRSFPAYFIISHTMSTCDPVNVLVPIIYRVELKTRRVAWCVYFSEFQLLVRLQDDMKVGAQSPCGLG